MIDKVLGDLDEIEQPVKENREVDKEEKCRCFTFQDPVDMSTKECDVCKIPENGNYTINLINCQLSTHEKMKFSIKDFFSKYDQIRI